MTLTTPIMMTRSGKPFSASFKADTALIRVFHILKLNYIFISLKHYKLYHYHTNTMNEDSVKVVKDTVGVLEGLKDRIPRAVQIIEGLLQQNQGMHNALHQENERLREEIRLATEEKNKLKQSEQKRREMLEVEMTGRQGQEADNAKLRAELRQHTDMIARLKREKLDDERETKEAKMTTKILQEQLTNCQEDMKKLQIQLDSAKEIENEIKSNAANQQALMVEQQQTLAAQTDSAQAAKRKEDVELGALRLAVAQMKQNMNLVRQILTNANIDDNTRGQLNEALDTSVPKSKMLSNKIKF